MGTGDHDTDNKPSVAYKLSIPRDIITQTKYTQTDKSFTALLIRHRKCFQTHFI